ncbi:hypothetical protein GCM10009734_16230 [Nonomuraea bangladeshensis]
MLASSMRVITQALTMLGFDGGAAVAEIAGSLGGTRSLTMVGGSLMRTWPARGFGAGFIGSATTARDVGVERVEVRGRGGAEGCGKRGVRKTEGCGKVRRREGGRGAAGVREGCFAPGKGSLSCAFNMDETCLQNRS